MVYLLDFSKAFNTVNHSILLNKLQKYGIRGTPLQWFTNYLTNRQQYVAIQNAQSTQQTVVCGVPQGSTLGPLLFLLYINDIINSSEKLSLRWTTKMASSSDRGFATSVDSVTQAIRQYEERTKSKFVATKKSKVFGSTIQGKLNHFYATELGHGHVHIVWIR